MRHFFFLAFFALIAVDLYSVVDATIGITPVSQQEGVRVARKSTSVATYSYVLFINDNDYAVAVSYKVNGRSAGVIYLQRGEQQHSHTAYPDSAKIEVEVKRHDQTLSSEERKAKRRKEKR